MKGYASETPYFESPDCDYDSGATLGGVSGYQETLLESLSKSVSVLEERLSIIRKRNEAKVSGEGVAVDTPKSNASPLVELLDNNNAHIQRVINRLEVLTQEVQI